MELKVNVTCNETLNSDANRCFSVKEKDLMLEKFQEYLHGIWLFQVLGISQLWEFPKLYGGHIDIELYSVHVHAMNLESVFYRVCVHCFFFLIQC